MEHAAIPSSCSAGCNHIIALVDIYQPDGVKGVTLVDGLARLAVLLSKLTPVDNHTSLSATYFSSRKKYDPMPDHLKAPAKGERPVFLAHPLSSTSLSCFHFFRPTAI
jgi:hypothetical protein